MALLKSIGAVTQLNQLILLDSPTPTSWLQPVLGLPDLESIYIAVTDDKDEEGTQFFLISTRLTKLAVVGCEFSKLSVRTLLPVGSEIKFC